MSAQKSDNVIWLKITKGLRHPANGIVFPSLFRVTGNFYNFDTTPGELAPPCYILSDTDNPSGDEAGIIVSNVEKIDVLNANVDKGWLVVRHHRSREVADGYIDAVLDTGCNDPGTCMLWQTDQGHFTILQRRTAEGRPDNLLIYITEVFTPTGIDVVSHIVFPDGSSTNDDEILYPPDY